MLPALRFLLGAALAAVLLVLTIFGLAATVRLAQETKVSPLEPPRALAYAAPARWTELYSVEILDRFDPESAVEIVNDGVGRLEAGESLTRADRAESESASLGPSSAAAEPQPTTGFQPTPAAVAEDPTSEGRTPAALSPDRLEHSADPRFPTESAAADVFSPTEIKPTDPGASVKEVRPRPARAAKMARKAKLIERVAKVKKVPPKPKTAIAANPALTASGLRVWETRSNKNPPWALSGQPLGSAASQFCRPGAGLTSAIAAWRCR
jgi:hypothetical protein